MKIIIAGSRGYNKDNFMKNALDALKKKYPNLELVSGAAIGPDMYAIRYAKKNNLICHQFPAEWSKYGLKAGPIRNGQMAIFADCLVAFWDEHSRGTRNMINNMKKLNKGYIVIGMNGKIIEKSNLGV